jgi:hypothetical protein
MSLVLNPITGATDKYHVLHGELQVGQIHRRKAAIRPEAQWLWALNGVPDAGLAATRDEAMAALKERWAKWLALAELSATD